jgi:ATP-dependent Clp protease ATP-binding subunit ClpX
MTDIMFDLPSRHDVREVIITPESVAQGTSPLVITERARPKKEA